MLRELSLFISGCNRYHQAMKHTVLINAAVIVANIVTQISVNKISNVCKVYYAFYQLAYTSSLCTTMMLLFPLCWATEDLHEPMVHYATLSIP